MARKPHRVPPSRDLTGGRGLPFGMRVVCRRNAPYTHVRAGIAQNASRRVKGRASGHDIIHEDDRRRDFNNAARKGKRAVEIIPSRFPRQFHLVCGRLDARQQRAAREHELAGKRARDERCLVVSARAFPLRMERKGRQDRMIGTHPCGEGG